MIRSPTHSVRRDAASRSSGRAFPVVELFGPTVQGEGPEAGRPAYFVRFGGCDWRCSWCDSPHAVDPIQIRALARQLGAGEIVAELEGLLAGPDLVVLSGGNPALLQLGELVDRLQSAKLRVALETQGSVWRDWLAQVDRLVISPKPPSSGMHTPQTTVQFEHFMGALAATQQHNAVLKIVVFDGGDLDFACEVHAAHPQLELHLSAGTDIGLAEHETIAKLRARYRWLCEAVADRPVMRRAYVRPQLHVIAWGTARGV